MQSNKQNIIIELTFEFAKNVILFCETMNESKKFVLSNQLLRSGTSIGANVREAQNSESKADFIHKMKLAAKEADETQYWLQLCSETPAYPNPVNLLQDCDGIIKVLSKIISSSKKSSSVNLVSEFEEEYLKTDAASTNQIATLSNSLISKFSN